MEVQNKPGNIPVSQTRVAAPGPEMGLRFPVIVMNDPMQPVVPRATAKEGVLNESLLGREAGIKAVISKAGSASSKPEIELLQAEPLETRVEPTGAANAAPPHR